jgi:hypothetical protein
MNQVVGVGIQFRLERVVEIMQVQRFVRDIGGTHLFAPAALRTGVQIQPLFPVELVQVVDA